MLSNRPYLARAFYQWIVDSGCTPVLVLDANHSSCILPLEYVENGEITLNISPDAIRDFKILSHRIEFKASFFGKVHDISASPRAIISIYAEENGEGIFFDEEEFGDDPEELNFEPTDKKVTYLRPLESKTSITIGDESGLDGKLPSRKKAKPRPKLKLVEFSAKE